MKHLLTVLVAIILITGSATGTYFYTRHQVFKEAYATGSSVGSKAGYSKGYSEGTNAAVSADLKASSFSNNNSQQEITSLTNQYNNLITQYNNLARSAHQSTYCSSINYGINNQFTSTTCN